MQCVPLLVPRRSPYGGGDGFDVYGDGGTGTVDYDTPLNHEPIRLWPAAPPHTGHLQDGHIVAGHLGAAPGGGHLTHRALSGNHLRPETDVVFEAGPYCFGRYRFAVMMRDSVGNANTQGQVLLSRTVNSPPRPAVRLRLSQFDSQTDRATFSFIGSPDVG